MNNSAVCRVRIAVLVVSELLLGEGLPLILKDFKGLDQHITNRSRGSLAFNVIGFSCRHNLWSRGGFIRER